MRSSLSQENLESLMLMNVETDILNIVSLDKVVDMLASTSTELKRLLSYFSSKSQGDLLPHPPPKFLLGGLNREGAY